MIPFAHVIALKSPGSIKDPLDLFFLPPVEFIGVVLYSPFFCN
jgi:hypothetical protein